MNEPFLICELLCYTHAHTHALAQERIRCAATFHHRITGIQIVGGCKVDASRLMGMNRRRLQRSSSSPASFLFAQTPPECVCSEYGRLERGTERVEISRVAHSPRGLERGIRHCHRRLFFLGRRWLYSTTHAAQPRSSVSYSPGSATCTRRRASLREEKRSRALMLLLPA